MKPKIAIAIVCVVIILIGGFIGDFLSDRKDAECTLGIGEHLCWKWKANYLSPNGKIDQDVGELINSQE